MKWLKKLLWAMFEGSAFSLLINHTEKEVTDRINKEKKQ